MKKIRNFSIIAHIDHGKSTLADRILDITKTVDERDRKEQFLDDMELEKERGITIKARAVTLKHTVDGEDYELNLIDTPGHVDFSYEVKRALQACEGTLLVVDATQGVEAQTVANLFMALEQDLEIIPVINKIDLPSSDIDEVENEIDEILGVNPQDIFRVSAKTGKGVKELLDGIVRLIPPPRNTSNQPARALIFDSWFDPYVGVKLLIRMFDGNIGKGEEISLMHSKGKYEIMSLEKYTPFLTPVKNLEAGDVGVVAAGIKSIQDVQIGETITSFLNPANKPLPGFKPLKQMVFSGIYPIENEQYEPLKKAMEKLVLNDSSFSYEPETSSALGFGFRCGFLGMLHLEIIKERIEREYNVDLITTAPSVSYKITTTDEQELFIQNPDEMPESQFVQNIEEPFVDLSIQTPAAHIGPVVKLCEDKRGEQSAIHYLSTDRVSIEYEIPLAEIVYDFYDRLKTVSRGYASMDYEFSGYKSTNLVKLNILINGKLVDALSTITHKENAYYMGRSLVQKMRKVIPRQMFDVPIQAAIGGRVVARETVKAYRKNVTAKCYGGDVSRKRKLLEKQKEGKKRMKNIGSVEIPQEAFLVVLDNDDEKN
ncbi:MAG: translation elongation factor 4 [bacterium]